MIKILLLLISLISFNCLIAQENAISVFKDQTEKEILIKENKRIRIKTANGKRISGRFKILDNETILIKNKKIKLSEIEKIKKNPLALSIITNGIFYYHGALLTGATIVTVAFLGNAVPIIFFGIPAAALIYGGIKSPNVLKGYKTKRNWKYKTTTIAE